MGWGPGKVWDTDHGGGGGSGDDYTYYRAIVDVFQLFLAFLYKHEDDVMANSAKTLAHYNHVNYDFNNPVVNIIHLYATVLADLQEPHNLG